MFLVAATIVCASVVAVFGQGPLAFEVASVRASQPGATSATLRRLPDNSFSGTNPGTAVPSQQTDQPAPVLLMLRTLLEDRFRLVARRDVRDTSVYALVLDRNDGHLGQMIRRPADDRCARARNAAAAANAAGIPLPPDAEDCGLRADGLNSTAATFSGRGVVLSDFARTLSGQVQQTVLDRTGLAGDWDFDLTFTPLRLRSNTPDSSLENASIFTALREQLGLKLEATKAPVDVLVIERVERPSAN